MKVVGANSYLPVPILSIKVKVERVPTNAQPLEYTHTELESYYITPDDARAGESGRKMTFQEAILMFIV